MELSDAEPPRESGLIDLVLLHDETEGTERCTEKWNGHGHGGCPNERARQVILSALVDTRLVATWRSTSCDFPQHAEYCVPLPAPRLSIAVVAKLGLSRVHNSEEHASLQLQDAFPWQSSTVYEYMPAWGRDARNASS